ncbi:MAG: glycoside hydrolase family 95 protein, partial [Lachnospiraceae bacterium]|nr:glycoside hydrolase family 95 protein [Lachnospiraceae bacterium]
MSRLWYKQPAKVWEEALPLGNGRLGAMIFGESVGEWIQVNEDSMWYGGKVDRTNPDTLKYLPEIRRLILNGEIRKAERLMKMAMSGCPDSAHPYQTLGNIHFNFENLGEITGYERSLSVDESLYINTFTSNGVTYKREAFISAPDDVMVMRITADKKAAITFQALLRREKFFDGVKKAGEDGICLYGNLGKGGFDFAMQLTAKAKGGSVCVIGEHLLVEDADEVMLYFCAGTTYRMENVEAEIDTIIKKAAEKSFSELLERHTADYKELYDRVDFSLGDLSAYDAIPTDVRMQHAAEGEADTGLSKLYFDFGRYLLISCSREGTLPATLQGIWNKDMLPPWDSKYTININTQMNYWLAENCNLSECHKPLFELIKTMVPNGRETARRMYGCRGFMSHHNTDIWGDCVTQDHWLPGSYWVMGAAWLCTHQWTHYEFTQDKEFLAEHYSAMKESAEFFVDYLTEDKNGNLVTCPSVSPENTYLTESGEKGCLCAGASMDTQIIRVLFNGVIKSAEILGKDAEFVKKLEEILKRLPETKIGKYGQIQEWAVDYDEVEIGHRHISQLYALHPADLISPYKTPKLADAARATLIRRIIHGGGHTGWSCAWIINMWARL